MDWFSTMGRRFWQAYTEGLAMNCPMHRCSGQTPAHIDLRQDNVRAAIKQGAPVRH